MRTITTTDLTVCTDCIMVIANGIDHHDEDQRNHMLAMWDHTADWKGTLAPGDETNAFSDRECDTCGTTLAGVRFAATLLTEVLTYDQPALPTYDEKVDAVMDWSAKHGLRHAIQRLRNNVLVCWSCDDGYGSSHLSAPRIPKPEPTGIEASMSRFD